MPSYIYFTPETDLAEVNAIAEENGHGPDSLSVELVCTADDSVWYGAHSFVDLMQNKPTLWSDADVYVVTEYYADGDPQANWQDALAINNLVAV